jgi:3-oxoacyl-[acyl-carrier protein] reductase
MDIEKQVAVVTGAASGIGNAVVRELAKRGASAVAMVDRSESVNAAASSVRESCGDMCHAVGYVGDVTDAKFRRTVYDDVTEKYGVPSICVPAAGITRDKLAVRLDKETGKAVLYPPDDFNLLVQVNLIAPAYWAMELIGKVAESRRVRGVKAWSAPEPIEGTIVFISSVSTHGIKGQIAYSACKAGLDGVAATLMKEAMYHGVRCAVIHPGFTDTPMVRMLGDDFIKKYILPQTELHRLIRPEEIARAICFMISESAMTGELWVDAGWHPQP